MSGLRLIADHSFCGNSFTGGRELQDFSSRSDLMSRRRRWRKQVRPAG